MQPVIAIVANRYSDFRRPIIERMAALLNASGYGVVCVIGRELQAKGSNSTDSMQAYNAIYTACSHYPVHGYIVLTSTLSFDGSFQSVIDLVHALSHKPIVSFGLEIPDIPSIAPDNSRGMHDLMQHMTSNTDRQNYVFIRGGNTMPDSIERESVFRKVLREKSIAIQEDLILDGRFLAADAFLAMSALLKRRKDIHAVIAANDIMALSAIQALREYGLLVPDDVIVSGFDDRPFAAESVPPLTTVSYDFAERADCAVNALIEQIQTGQKKPLDATCNCFDLRLITRRSSASPERVDQNSHIDANTTMASTASAALLPERILDGFVQKKESVETVMDSPRLELLASLRSTSAGLYHEFESNLSIYTRDPSRQISDLRWCESLMDDCETYLIENAEHVALSSYLSFIRRSRLLATEARLLCEQNSRLETERVRRLQDDLHIELASCCELSELESSLDTFSQALPLSRLHLVFYKTLSGESAAQTSDILSLTTQGYQWLETDFVTHDILPPHLKHELDEGLLVLIPLCASNETLGHLIVDPSNLPALSIESMANSIANAMISCRRLTVFETQASDLRQKNESLSYLADYDVLTGLANRSGFSKHLESCMQRARRELSTLEVLFIDLDGFKSINDTWGHRAGDTLLKQFSQRMNNLMRNTDLCGRFGGDEFCVLMESEFECPAANALADRILAALEEPFRIMDWDVVLTASIGISRFGSKFDEGDNTEDLLRQSDTAMYHAKAAGKNRYSVYLNVMAEKIQKRIQLECAIQKGLEHSEFKVEYQPRVDVATGSIKGFEALMRWKPQGTDIHPDDTSPAVFIPIAEASSTIIKLDRLALKQACQQLRHWIDHDLLHTRMSVNMSVRRLQQPGLVDEIRDTLNQYNIDPGMIELELTESAAMDDIASNIKTLKELRLIGVQLSIDDFGTGYSSLSYLKKLPVTCLKIDQSFLKGVMENNFDNHDAQIIKTIISLGKSMGYALVAEGVEKQEQSDFLIENGCEQAQGYLYSPSLSAANATALLSQSVQGMAHAQ